MNHRLLESNPRHPSLHVKVLEAHDPPLWSVRVGRSYRALAIEEAGDLFWIGSHAEYDRILSTAQGSGSRARRGSVIPAASAPGRRR